MLLPCFLLVIPTLFTGSSADMFLFRPNSNVLSCLTCVSPLWRHLQAASERTFLQRCSRRWRRSENTNTDQIGAMKSHQETVGAACCSQTEQPFVSELLLSRTTQSSPVRRRSRRETWQRERRKAAAGCGNRVDEISGNIPLVSFYRPASCPRPRAADGD